MATELDSVPGGIGFTASLGQRYARLGYEIVGGADGMASGFMHMIRSVGGVEDAVLGVVISEESSAWRPEMAWLGEVLNGLGLETYVVRPEEILFSEAGAFCGGGAGTAADRCAVPIFRAVRPEEYSQNRPDSVCDPQGAGEGDAPVEGGTWKKRC